MHDGHLNVWNLNVVLGKQRRFEKMQKDTKMHKLVIESLEEMLEGLRVSS